MRVSIFSCFLAALALRTEVEHREPPDWQPLIETWKMKGGHHSSDVVEAYKAVNPPATKDFRKIRRHSRVLMSKLRRQILNPWKETATVAAVEQGTFRLLWSPQDLLWSPEGVGIDAAPVGVLYTLGLGPCIGIAMEAVTEHPSGTAIALAHADSSTDVTAAMSKMTQEIQRLGQVSNISLTLIGGRVSAEGKIRAQFASILEKMNTFQQKSEMCTLLSPGAVAGGVAGGVVSTQALPSLTSEKQPAVACADELVNHIQENAGEVTKLGGKLATFQLPTGR
eukprot:Skav231331  [mRNA]  locus=scaffold819:87927:88769:- [translate_table: standard]